MSLALFTLSFYRLEKMGGLGRKSLTEYGQIWRLFTFPCMHAGLIHLVINLSSVIFVGIQLEHEYGPGRPSLIFICFLCFHAEYYIETCPFLLLSSKDWDYLSTLCLYWHLGGCTFCSKQPLRWFIWSFIRFTWSYAFWDNKELETLL